MARRPTSAFHAAATAGVGLELEAATIESALDAAVLLPSGRFLDINVSPDLVMAGEPLGALLAASSSDVVLEITEHVSVHDYGELRQAIATLGKDVRFSVDDAGAGFASMRHILELAPTQVKLDRALVARIDADPARQALVTGLVHFAQAIDVMLIAEGSRPKRNERRSSGSASASGRDSSSGDRWRRLPSPEPGHAPA